jgi:hypothetical protein
MEKNNPVTNHDNPISDAKMDEINKKATQEANGIPRDHLLYVDDVKVPHQNFALISIVSPEGKRKYKQVCVKIKGVFDTIEKANSHAKLLQKIDDQFDIYVVDMYSWLLVPPPDGIIEESIHADETLDSIIRAYKEVEIKSKLVFNERKTELLDSVKTETKLYLCTTCNRSQPFCNFTRKEHEKKHDRICMDCINTSDDTNLENID